MPVALLLSCVLALPPTVRADVHVHLTMKAQVRPLFSGEPGDGRALTASPSSMFTNSVDPEGLRRAGVRLVVAAVWPSFALRPGRTALDEALHQLRELHAFARRHPDFALVKDAKEAREAIAHGRIAVVPEVEGGEGIERVEDVDLLYAEGMRALLPIHFTGNGLGGAAPRQVWNVFGDGAFGLPVRGLSPFGRQVVARLIELGVVMDLAHASEPTAQEILDLAGAAKAPVLCSHQGAWALAAVQPNIGDGLVRRIGQSGGLLGLILDRPHLELPSGAAVGTCDDVLAHWAYFARLAGRENVVLGSDLNSTIRRAIPGGSCPSGLRNAGDLAELFSALERQGFGSRAERVLQLLEAVESRASPAARAAAGKRRWRPPDLFDVPL